MKTILLTLLLAFSLNSYAQQDTVEFQMEYDKFIVLKANQATGHYEPMHNDTIYACNTAEFGSLGTITITNEDGESETFNSYGEIEAKSDGNGGIYLQMYVMNNTGMLMRIKMSKNSLLLEYPWLGQAYLFFK